MATPSQKGTGRAKSCVVCRQFKLACDARKTAPGPCSRCVSKNLKCRFDPNFKRISTRKIAQEVADELHTLRAAQNVDASSRSGGTPHSYMLVGGQSPAPFRETSRASVSSNSSLGQQNTDLSQPRWLELADDEIVLDQVVHGVSVSSSRILKLFYHFDQYYYPHARFLPKLTSINVLAAKSQLLFWTVLLLAAERYEGGSDGLYEQLCSSHDLLMADVLHKAIQKLEVVHALLLLCLWPIPRLRNAYDPSWNYVALATSAAASLNCHSPLQADEATSQYKGLIDTTAAEMQPSIQAMTWIECYQMGIRQCAYLGLPPPLSAPQQARTIRRLQQLANSIITPTDRAATRIYDVLCGAQSNLDAIEDASSHFSMTQTYETQLDGIAIQYQEKWSWGLQVQLLAAKIYIFGITLTQDLPFDEDELSQAFGYRQIILEKGMKAASSLVSTMADMSNQEISGRHYPSGILTFYPKHYFTSLMAAAAYLFRFLLSYQGATQAQQSHSINRIAEAHKIFQSFPEHRDAIRASITIEIFVNSVRTPPGPNDPPVTELAVKNRLGASVVHDASFRASRQRNRHPFDGSSPPVTQWTTMNEDNAHRLPLAPEQKVVSPKNKSWTGSYVSSSEMQPQDPVAWMGLWDTYSNEFGVLNEPWVQNDDEFAMSGLQSQTFFAERPRSGHVPAIGLLTGT